MTSSQMIPKEYEDFRVFLKSAWGVLGLPNPTPAQYRIAYFLQNGPKRKGTRCFRGVGKSWITSVFCLWCLMWNPEFKILVVSASKERADNFTTFTRMVMDQWDLLHHLIPSASQRDSRISFDVRPASPAHAPSVKSVGIFGQMSGSRADLIVADDVEVPNNSETQPKRDKLVARVGEFEDILKPGGSILFLGTPQTEDSIYTKLTPKGYTELIIPARYPDPTKIYEKYGTSLDPVIQKQVEDNPRIAGKSTDPARFSDADLTERELSKGRSSFALQFMLDTSLSDGDKYPLRLRDLIISDVDRDKAAEKYVFSNDVRQRLDIESVGLKGDYYHRPAAIVGDYLDYTGTVMYLDPSGRGRDETAYSVVKMLNGNLFVPSKGIGGFPGGYEDKTLETIALTAKNLGVNTVVIESNFGDGMFTKLITPFFRKIHPVEVLEKSVHKQKELRIIDTLEPLFNQHRIVIDPKVIAQDKLTTSSYSPEEGLSKQFFYQLSRITKDRNSLRHDDRLDAFAGACGYWVESMAQDADDEIDKRAKELEDLHLKGMGEIMATTIIYSQMGMTPEQIGMCVESRGTSGSLLLT